MKVRDVMSIEPLTVGTDVPPETARQLMEQGRVHHLPIVEGDQLVGMWVATDKGPVVLLGPDRVREVSPDVTAIEAMQAMMGEEAVVAMSDGQPVGILTRSDAIELVRGGLDVAKRNVPPLVVRLVGPGASGKTTLILRTLAGMTRRRAGAIEANPEPPADRLPPRISGAPVSYAPEAHWRKGFREAIEHMGGLDLILVEDRDQPPEASLGLGEDVQVIVVPVAYSGTIHLVSLVDAQAVVLTKPAEAPGFDDAAERARLRGINPNLAVFVIGPAEDDHGMQTWRQWLEARLLQHRR
jgi:CBS domain-containing protein